MKEDFLPYVRKSLILLVIIENGKWRMIDNFSPFSIISTFTFLLMAC
ncbi:hypothetical protein NSA07_00090 [Clostridium cochlearium]|nr:hypothetical protein [Clostridium cochlearium]